MNYCQFSPPFYTSSPSIHQLDAIGTFRCLTLSTLRLWENWKAASTPFFSPLDTTISTLWQSFYDEQRTYLKLENSPDCSSGILTQVLLISRHVLSCPPSPRFISRGGERHKVGPLTLTSKPLTSPLPLFFPKDQRPVVREGIGWLHQLPESFIWNLSTRTLNMCHLCLGVPPCLEWKKVLKMWTSWIWRVSQHMH